MSNFGSWGLPFTMNHESFVLGIMAFGHAELKQVRLWLETPR